MSTTLRQVLDDIAAAYRALMRFRQKRRFKQEMETGATVGAGAYFADAPQSVTPPPLVLNWTTGDDDGESMRTTDGVVVFVNPTRHRGRDVARILLAYLHRGLIPYARQAVAPQVMKAVDWLVARRLAEAMNEPAAKDELVEARRAADPAVGKLMHDVDRVDVHGYVTRILLAEYQRVACGVAAGDAPDLFIEETSEFAKWLCAFAVRRRGDSSTSLRFDGTWFRIQLMLIGHQSLTSSGMKEYASDLRKGAWNGGLDAIAMLGRDRYIPAVQRLFDHALAHDFVQEQVSEIYRYPLRGDFSAVTGLDRSHTAVARLVLRRTNERRREAAFFAGIRARGDHPATHRR